MKYDEALGRWGAAKLGIDGDLWEEVGVDMDVEGGCYGGHYEDEYCYCDSAVPVVNIVYYPKNQHSKWKQTSIELRYSYTIGSLLQEILEFTE